MVAGAMNLRHGVGKPVGDPRVMAGTFVVRGAELLRDGATVGVQNGANGVTSGGSAQ